MGQLLNPRNSREDSKSEKNAPELERVVAASSAMQTVPAESDMVFIFVPPIPGTAHFLACIGS